MQLHDICSEIQTLHRANRYYMRQQVSQMLKLGAHLRSSMGWKKDAPNSKAIMDEADRIIEIGERVFKADEKQRESIKKAVAKGMPVPPPRALEKDEDDPSYRRFATFVQVGMRGCQGYLEQQEITKKEMGKRIEALPIWKEWAKGVCGLSSYGVAQIVAEATNPTARASLSDYASHSKLWKRFGLAVMDGVRQGGLNGSASAADWIAHGYVGYRRSFMHVIGDRIIFQQVRKVKDDDGNETGERRPNGPYGEVYLNRKQYERERNPEMTPKQVDMRARRYMEKRLLKHLWQAWRRAIVRMPERATTALPAANEHRDAV